MERMVERSAFPQKRNRVGAAVQLSARLSDYLRPLASLPPFASGTVEAAPAAETEIPQSPFPRALQGEPSAGRVGPESCRLRPLPGLPPLVYLDLRQSLRLKPLDWPGGERRYLTPLRALPPVASLNDWLDEIGRGTDAAVFVRAPESPSVEDGQTRPGDAVNPPAPKAPDEPEEETVVPPTRVEAATAERETPFTEPEEEEDAEADPVVAVALRETEKEAPAEPETEKAAEITPVIPVIEETISEKKEASAEEPAAEPEKEKTEEVPSVVREETASEIKETSIVEPFTEPKAEEAANVTPAETEEMPLKKEEASAEEPAAEPGEKPDEVRLSIPDEATPSAEAAPETSEEVETKKSDSPYIIEEVFPPVADAADEEVSEKPEEAKEESAAPLIVDEVLSPAADAAEKADAETSADVPKASPFLIDETLSPTESGVIPPDPAADRRASAAAAASRAEATLVMSDGARANPYATIDYDTVVEETPADASVPEDESELERVHPSTADGMPTPVSAPADETKAEPDPPVRRRHRVWVWTAVVALAIIIGAAVYQSGLWARLAQPAATQAPEVAATAASLTAGMTAGTESTPTTTTTEQASEAAQASEAVQLEAMAVTPTETTAPATLAFSLETNLAVRDVRLLTDASGILNITNIYSTPKDDGLLWSITANITEAYAGNIRVFLRDQSGAWVESDASCAVDIQ